MISRVLKIINQYSLANPLLKVNNLFFKSDKKSDLLRLENNFVFRHACMTPLTILSCSLDNMENNSQADSQNIKNAKLAVSHLTKLIKTVTNHENRKQDFDVNMAVNEVVLLFKNKTNCEIYIKNALPKNTIIRGSKIYFQEILVCLLNNAYEAYKDRKMAHVCLSVRIIKGQVFIGVVDFAKGMTNMGQFFAMVKGISYKEQGMGLGLSFVKHTIEKEFKGVLKIISGYGVGTHVQVAIPIQLPYNQSPLQS